MTAKTAGQCDAKLAAGRFPLIPMILVTGGAGFIGANFVLDWLANHGEPVVNLDKLTYAGNLRSLVALAGDARHVFVRGDIGDAERSARCSPSTGRARSSISRPRRMSTAPFTVRRAFIDTNVVGTFALLECIRELVVRIAGRRAPRVPLSARVDRRGLRLARAARRAVQRDDALCAEQPVLGIEGGVRSPGARVSPYLRIADAHDQLLEQLRAVSVPRETDPADDRQRAAGKPLPVYGDGRNVRDWLYVGDHCAAIRAVLARGQPGRDVQRRRLRTR